MHDLNGRHDDHPFEDVPPAPGVPDGCTAWLAEVLGLGAAAVALVAASAAMTVAIAMAAAALGSWLWEG